MDKIDEKKILEFCGVKEKTGEWWVTDHSFTCGWLEAPDGKRFLQKYSPLEGTHHLEINIYSLDWQKEYLWPKFDTFETYLYRIGDGDFYANIELGNKAVEAHDKDPATAILKAVMELIDDL